MIDEEDEYFLRTSILLLKGGRLMSKETLYKELRMAGGDIDVLLKQNKRKITHKFVKKQREKLFPDAGVTDVETWDLAMLTTVLLTVFKHTLTIDDKKALKSIKYMRDEIYAHAYSSSLSVDQYEEIRKELQKALTSLSNGLSEKLQEDCFQIIQECTTGPISPSLKAELTKHLEDTENVFQAVMNKFRNQNEYFCQMKKEIMDKLNKMCVIEDRSEKIIKVIDTELTLSGAVNESKDIDFVEEIITTVINKAIKKVGNANDCPRIRSVVDKILKDIENMPDESCTTYIGAKTNEHMWSLLEIDGATKRLKELAEALSDKFKTKITDTPSVNLEQVQSAIKEAERNDQIETRVLLEESTEKENRKHSDMVTSVRTDDFSIKHVETNVNKTGATVGESTSTNDSTVMSMEHIERNVCRSDEQHNGSAKMQEISNTAESKVTCVGTNDYMNSTLSFLTRESSLGYPLKKSLDDTLSESMLERLLEQMKSVGVLVSRSRDVGTVFRVGSKYVMTAFHVVKDLVGFARNDSIYVTFHESALDLQRKVYHVEKVIFFNQDLDVVVLELAHSESTLPPKMQLSKDDVDALNVKDVSFIGYGHPEECSVKHLDPRCKLIHAKSQRILEARTWLGQNSLYIKNAVSKMGQDPAIVNEGYGSYTDNHRIIFDCYMQQGASGAPGLIYSINGQAKVIGVLTHGLPEFYFLMPKLTQHLVKDEYRFEVASKMSSIYSRMFYEKRDLAYDLFG